jgi:membrane-associated phospholipid phosphatase
MQFVGLVVLAAIVRVSAYAIGPVARADVRLMEVSRLPWGTTYRLAQAILSPFDPLPYVLLVAAVVGAAVLAGRREAGVAAALLLVGAEVTTQALKPLLAEHRSQAFDTWLPPSAWPSGHATGAAALAIAVVLVTPPGRRGPVAVVAGLFTAAVCVALVALARHYPSDVLGGLCVAGAWGVIAWRVQRRRGAAGRRGPSGVRTRGPRRSRAT